MHLFFLKFFDKSQGTFIMAEISEVRIKVCMNYQEQLIWNVFFYGIELLTMRIIRIII